MLKYLLVFISVFFSKILFAQTKYENYCNARFQFCIVYPNDFKTQPESDNGDGRIFVSKDEKAEIRAYGSLENEETNNLTRELKYAEKRTTISYKVVSKNYFIISGIDKNGNIFYRKTLSIRLKDYFNSGPTKVLQTLTITYPKSQTKKYANYCKKIALFN